MEGQNDRQNGRHWTRPVTPRDFVAVVFRRRRLAAIAFLGIFVGAVLAALILPDQYEARMAILVNRDRVNLAVTPQAAAVPDGALAISEEEVNSEVELLQSRDMLEKVVRDCNLYRPKSYYVWTKLIPSLSADAASQTPEPEPQQVARAVRKLGKKLNVQLVKRSNMIHLSYESPDPQLSARVLNTLAKLYLEKHALVHRPPGASDFFEQETSRYRKGLEDAESRLVTFTSQQGVVDGQVEKDLALHKLNEFDASLRQTQASIAETEKRIRALEAEAKDIPSRMTTQVKTGDNGLLLENLTATLLQLELKRTELLGKFEPSYRPVQEVEKQIAETRAALTEAERSPLKEQTTDRDPTHEWLRGELAKANADLAGLQARAAATAVAVRAYQQNARWLDEKEIAQQDLMRNVKATEENYLLYLRKWEEARIADALDRRRIVNVAISEAATVPALPAYPKSSIVMLGSLLALMVSIGLAFGADYLDPTFRTPDQVEASLDIPVLASLPKNGKKGN